MVSMISNLNLAFTFTIVIIFIILLQSYKKAKKINLYQSVISFLSIAFCIYVLFTIERIFTIFEFTRYMKLKTISMVFLFLIFLFLYIIVKLFIKFIFRMFYLKQILLNKFKFQNLLIFFILVIRKTIFIAYILVIITIAYNKLYFTGLTKPIVNAGIVNNSITASFDFVESIEKSHQQINSFTSLFSTEKMKEDILETENLLKELETYEEEFIDNIYPNLSEKNKDKVKEKYQEYFEKKITYKGSLLILLEDDLYKEVFGKPKYNKISELIIKIPYVNNLLFKDVEIYNLYNYLDNNKELIYWLQENRLSIEKIDKDDNDLLLINNFLEDYTALSKIKDKSNLDILKKINKTIDDYFKMQEWMIKLMELDIEEKEIVEDVIYVYLQNGDNLDEVIQKFNQDYKKGKFTSEYERAFEFTKDYLKNYRKHSLKIKHDIDPKVRIGSAVIKKLDISLFENERSLYYILTYINDSCFQTREICSKDYRFDLVEMILWGAFSETVDDNLRISSEKLSKLFNNIDQIEGYNKDLIIIELKILNDELMFKNRNGLEKSFIEENYHNNRISYDVLKVFYRNKTYISTKYFNKLQELIK